jgi:cell division septation protein DedD
MAYNLGQIDPEQRTGLYVDPGDEEGAAPAPRRMFRIAGALLVMGLFAGGLCFAYMAGLRHAGGTGEGSDIPLIHADNRPIKVKPDDPGGMHIADRNMLIYGDNRPSVEHLLPPPEQPMPLPAAASPPAPAPLASAEQPAAPPATAPPTAAPTAQPAASAGHPPANPPAESSKSTDARQRPGKSGGVRLQLGAVRSEGVARDEWDRIKRANPDLLGHLTAVAVRAELGDKGVYYRIQAGPVADTATAQRLCGELKQRHLGCIVVR